MSEPVSFGGTLLVVVNIGTALVVVLLAYILNGLRDSFRQLSADLKGLNDAVLGRYMSREEIERRMKEYSDKAYALRGEIYEARMRIAVLEQNQNNNHASRTTSV